MGRVKNAYAGLLPYLILIHDDLKLTVKKREFEKGLKNYLWLHGSNYPCGVDCPESLDVPGMQTEVFREVVSFLRKAVLDFTTFDEVHTV